MHEITSGCQVGSMGERCKLPEQGLGLCPRSFASCQYCSQNHKFGMEFYCILYHARFNTTFSYQAAWLRISYAQSMSD